jgi:hypothetical protein
MPPLVWMPSRILCVAVNETPTVETRSNAEYLTLRQIYPMTCIRLPLSKKLARHVTHVWKIWRRMEKRHENYARLSRNGATFASIA